VKTPNSFHTAWFAGVTWGSAEGQGQLAMTSERLTL
jgi:hypothetical protein